MLDASQQWQLFGFDMRNLGRYWQQAWAEFLWGDQSPLRPRLDEVVLLESESGSEYYQAGRSVQPTATDCQALLLPDDLVLFKRLRVPVAAEAELAAVVALEVSSSSPFLADDTGYGWTRIGRDEQHIHLQLAIVSLSASMRYIGRVYDIHDLQARELWARSEGEPIVIQGFGETKRLQRYKRRLLRISALLGLCALALLGMLSLAAGSSYIEMRYYNALNESVSAQARDAANMRAALLDANETIRVVNEISATYPSPHVELAKLTHLLGDDAYIVQYLQQGEGLRIRGRAIDAASVVQKLTSAPGYAEVNSPQAITAVGNTGLQQFSLNIQLKAGADS
ncbi:general secretion pathway protein GspL [Parahaliea sp. F7430]|uniref:General secretion pathway protein GspL n=1 Tax=Sediminihaliea albiluteola TaxID=2758564 RepID=A0A7W2TYH3_9GAMM|nr:PilN domain-containing protein [Sediminihaliea albiluteola]MBA6414271.1 general secretion pathway protein GspL [Sediminihaliea albiluteola]